MRNSKTGGQFAGGKAQKASSRGREGGQKRAGEVTGRGDG